MSRARWAAAAVVVVLVIVVVVAWYLLRGESYGPTVEVTRGDIEATIETVGTVDLRDQSILTTPISTGVDVRSVDPGDQVQEGDVLLTLDREPFRAAIEEAESRLYEAETTLATLEATESPETAEGLTERVNAQQRVEEARTALEQAEENLSESMVLAPEDGMIVTIPVEEGDPVEENEELVQIARMEAFVLTLQIDEVDLPLISTGADVSVVLEAYPDHVIESEIHTIARRAETSGGTTVFPATIRFPAQEDLMILPGMNAEVEVTTEVREDVLLLPEGSFQTVGRRTFVEVVEDGEVVEREIRTGVRSEGMVEIADGLEEGDRVVLP